MIGQRAGRFATDGDIRCARRDYGHSLFIKDKKLYYVYNFLGIPEQQFVFVSPDELVPNAPNEEYTFVVEFNKEPEAGTYGESLGETKLSVNGTVVAQGPMKAQVGKFTLCGDGLCVGYDSADAVSELYSKLPNPSNPFRGGTIHKVVITPGEEEITEVINSRLLAGAFSAD